MHYNQSTSFRCGATARKKKREVKKKKKDKEISIHKPHRIRALRSFIQSLMA